MLERTDSELAAYNAAQIDAFKRCRAALSCLAARPFSWDDWVTHGYAERFALLWESGTRSPEHLAFVLSGAGRAARGVREGVNACLASGD